MTPLVLMPSLAQIAYEAYRESQNWTNGDHLPQWHDQPQNLKSAWHAAAHAVQANLSTSGATRLQVPPGDNP